ncbi:hypothetical protein GCM10017624_16370 [Azotobacter vinelandii]|nr:hypothetical protein GCM10017624_16370 [Azotobacter vinelandii]
MAWGPGICLMATEPAASRVAKYIAATAARCEQVKDFDDIAGSVAEPFLPNKQCSDHLPVRLGGRIGKDL